MSLVKRSKGDGYSEAELADAVVSTKLWKRDHEQFDRLCKMHRKKPAEMLRLLVNEALTQQELLSRESGGDSEGMSRRCLQDLIFEQLKPLRQGLEGVTNCLNEVALMIGELPTTPSQPSAAATGVGQVEFFDLLTKLDQNLEMILEGVNTGHRSTVQMGEAIKRKQERMESLSQITYALSGHTFTWAWTILDLLTRYAAVPQVAAMDTAGDAAEASKEVEKEIEKDRGIARRKRRGLERKLRLPLDIKVSFLSEPHEQ